jgi:hypothetical protein
MDCGRASRLVSSVALGESEPRDLSDLREHLSVCPDCRRQLSRTRWLLRVVDCALVGMPAMAGLPHWSVARLSTGA